MLQRLIRGRAVQNLMFEGKEKRLALIEELLIVSNIPPLPKEEEEKLLVNQHEQQVKNAFLEALQGGLISETLDGLSKELLRFKEEKKIAKFVKEAEKDRRIREAEETGRRQAEITLSDREDVLYREIMKVHQGTVDSYLTITMAKAVDHLASKQALHMAKLRKNQLKTLDDNTKQETIIKDLVSCFLIPNVDRCRLKQRVDLEQRRYSEAVKSSMKATIKGVAEKKTDEIKDMERETNNSKNAKALDDGVDN